MARKPFRSSPKRKAHYGATNKLYEAATQSNDRLPIPRTDYDHRRNISELGWRELVSASRGIYANHPHIRGVIDQMVNLAVGQTFRIQYTGRNREWGEMMEEAILEHDKICDVRGFPYDFVSGLKLDLTSVLRDGDSTCLLVENEDGFPLYQSIAAHRIGSRNVSPEIVEGGPYGGSQIVNGVILNEASRPIALRVYKGDTTADEYEDISIDSAVFAYLPSFTDQARGVPALASAINTCLDVEEIRKFLRIGIKAEAAISLVEENESGQAVDSARARQSAKPTADTPTQPFVQEFHYGMYRYFKAGTNSKITAVNSRRPAAETMNFDFELLRAALESFGWPIEMYDPSRVGGAPSRLRLGLAIRTIEKLQKLVMQMAYRKHLYTISKKIQSGELPPDVDFYKFTHQVPRDLTVDNGRDTKADLELYLKGAIDIAQLASWYGNDWQDVFLRKAEQAKFKFEAAKKFGVPVTEIQLLTPNANDPAAMAEMPEKKDQPATTEKP
jgi:hypothetical protein